MAKSEEEKVRAKIKKFVDEHPDAVMEVLLDTPFWPQGLNKEESYTRYGDDDSSFLRVVFSPDGDVWPNVFHLEMQGDAKHFSMSPRYRTYFGGGMSLRTRTALLILAKAIAIDNADRPQKRTP